MRELDGRNAFITGGASGIGLAMADAFLARGMKVVIADRNAGELERARVRLGNERLHCVVVDVTDRVALARAADEAEQVFGPVHLLCNNAGVSGPVAIEDAGFADWDWMLGINLGGVINGIVTFLPRMRAHAAGGHIVNTASMAGILPVGGVGGLYTTGKFAVVGLSEALRLSLATEGIGVSVLCPGLTRTNLIESGKTRPGFQEQPMAELDRGFLEAWEGGMEPAAVAECVVAGILANAAYVLPHAEFREEVAELFRGILAAFPTTQAIDPRRLAFEHGRRRATEQARAAADKLGAPSTAA